MPQVTWSTSALEDLERLYAFVAENNPNAARRATQSIVLASKNLEQFPELGKPMTRRTNYRELFAYFGQGSYVLRYRITPQGNIIIVRVWHSREKR